MRESQTVPTSPETNKKPPKGGGGGNTHGATKCPTVQKRCVLPGGVGGHLRFPASALRRQKPKGEEPSVWILGGSGVGGLVIRGTRQHQWRLGSSRVVAHGARQRPLPSPVSPRFLPPRIRIPPPHLSGGGDGGSAGLRGLCTHHAAPFSSPSFCGRGRWGTNLGAVKNSGWQRYCPRAGDGEGCENIRIEFART